MGVLLAWLGAAWSAITGLLITMGTVKFTVGAAFIAAFLLCWVSLTATIQNLITGLTYTTSHTQWPTFTSSMAYITPPHLPAYLAAIVSGYIAMMTCRALITIYKGIASA